MIRRLLPVLALVVAVGSAGCASTSPQLTDPTTHGPSAAPDGLAEEAAIARALAVAPPGDTTPAVVWASVEPDPFRVNGQLVWIVRLEGGIAAPACAPEALEQAPSAGGDPCLDSRGGVNVVLDHRSGALLGWMH